MADRFFIGTGTETSPADWSDTANWSETKNGSGGASVPVSADPVIFCRSAYIANVPNDRSGRDTVELGVDIVLNFASAASGVRRGGISIRSGGSCECKSNTSLNLGTFGDENTKTEIDEGGLLKSRGGYIYTRSLVINHGYVDGWLTPQQSNVVRPGRCRSLCPFNNSGPLKLAGRSEVTEDLLFISSTQPGYVVTILDAIKAGTLQFSYGNIAPEGVAIAQKSPLSIEGNIVSGGADINGSLHSWTLDAGVQNIFEGPADQVINMPPWAAGQTWQLKKGNIQGRRAGLLDLQSFSGTITGTASDPGFAGELRVGAAQDVTAGTLQLDKLTVDGSLFIPTGAVVECDDIEVGETGSVTGGGTLRPLAGTWHYVSDAAKSRIQVSVDSRNKYVVCLKK